MQYLALKRSDDVATWKAMRLSRGLRSCKWGPKLSKMVNYRGKGCIWDVLEDCFVAFIDLARPVDVLLWWTTH